MSIPALSLSLQALDAGAPAESAAPLASGPDLVQYLLVSSAMVVAVAFLGWCLRRYVAGNLRLRAAGRSLAVIDALPLGGRAKLAVVRVYDRTFVVGLGEKEVNLVAELDGRTPAETELVPGARRRPGALAGAFERLRARVGEGRPKAGAGAAASRPASARTSRSAGGARATATTAKTASRLGGGRGLLG